MTKYQKEIRQAAAGFLDRLLPHFDKDLHQKVQQLVDDWVNYFELTEYHADVEDLWLEIFTKDIVGGGSFFYREFSSADEAENWDEAVKFDRAVVVISVPSKESVLNMSMSDLAKIMTPLYKHCASDDSLLYYAYAVEAGVEGYPCRVMYHTTDE